MRTRVITAMAAFTVLVAVGACGKANDDTVADTTAGATGGTTGMSGTTTGGAATGTTTGTASGSVTDSTSRADSLRTDSISRATKKTP
jgi:hypothetical protein